MPRLWFHRGGGGQRPFLGLVDTNISAALQEQDKVVTAALDSILLAPQSIITGLDAALLDTLTRTASLNASLIPKAPAAPPTVVFAQPHEAMAGARQYIRVPRPDGLQHNDLLLAQICMDDDTTSAINIPSGWTELDHRTDDLGIVRHWVGWKRVVGGSPDGEPEFYTWWMDVAEFGVGAIVHIQGDDLAAPINVEGWSTSNGNTGTGKLNGITTLLDNTELIQMICVSNALASGIVKPAAGSPEENEILNHESGGVSGTFQGIAHETISPAAATGDRDWTITGTDDYVGGLVAILGDNDGALPSPTRDPVTPPVVQTQGSGTADPGTDCVVTAPSGIVEGDLLLTYVVSDGNHTITQPGGSPDEEWETIFEDAVGDLSVWCGFKHANNEEPADYTFTVPSSERIMGEIIRIDGHDDTSPGPIEASSHAINQTAAISLLTDSLTPRSDNNLLLVFGGADAGAADEIHLSENGETEIKNGTIGGTAGVHQAISWEVWHSEATAKRGVRVNQADQLAIGMVIIAAAQ